MTAPRKLKVSEVVKVRVAIQARQGNLCCVCKRKFSTKVVGCLDHNHSTGFIRGVLCRACNRLEGQVKNRLAMAGAKDNPEGMLIALAEYYTLHKTPQYQYLHPSHKTDAEKRDAINKKARAKRAALKKE